jgi:purine-binding chemotaxis protein CheW
LPVIDQRRRFAMPELNAPKQRLLVVRTQRHRAGLLVDGIVGVVLAPERNIAPAPRLTGETASMVSGLLNLATANRIILLLDPDELLSRAERGLLDNFSQQKKPEN